jgi:hypothetical protein
MTTPTRRPRAPHPSWRPEWGFGSVVVGYTHKRKPLFIPADMRALGCHIIGLPGQGKSRAAEAMLRQDILELDGMPRGGLLIDPHGTLYGNLLRWYTVHALHRVRKIRVLDPSDPRFIFHLNPLRRRQDVDPAVVASAVVNAVLRVWCGDATATPQLRTTLKHTFYTLSELELPLTRAADLLDLTDSTGLRSYASVHVSNPVVRQFWRELSTLRLAQREERVGSAMRRLTEFLLPARVRAIFGDADRAIDWRQVMDDGEIVILNLAFDSGRLSEDEAQVIGVMILAEIFLACQGRPEGALPFYLYIDECHRYLTEDLAKVIVEGRKFGVHAGALIHQTLGQLREAGEFVFSAVMAARTKIAFGGLEPDDAEYMARSVFRGQFDLSRDKERFRKPVVVGQELGWLLSESDSHGTSVAKGTNWSEGGSHAEQRSTTITRGSTTGVSDTTSTSRTRSCSNTASASDTSAHSRTNSSSNSESSGGSASRSLNGSASAAQQYDEDGVSIGGPTRTDGTAGSDSAGTSWGRGSATGAADTTGRTQGTSFATQRSVADTTGHAHTTSTSLSESIAETFGTTDTIDWSHGGSTTIGASETRTEGRSQGLRSVFEVLPGQAYTLEELLHLASVKIANLPQGEAIVKIGRRPSARVKILRVKDGFARPEHVARVTAELAAETPYITPAPSPAPPVPPRQIPALRVVPPENDPPSKLPLGPKPVDDEWG